MKAKYDLIKETAIKTGDVLAKAENIVYLHEKPIRNALQIENTNRGFNNAYNKFNSDFIKIDYRLKVLFNNNRLNEEWETIYDEVIELNKILDLLGEFATQTISLDHSERIDGCKQKIRSIKNKLSAFADVMINNIY